MVVECELKVGWTAVKRRMRRRNGGTARRKVLGRICGKERSETRGLGEG